MNYCFYDRPLTYLVSYVDLGEAESLQMGVGGADGRSDGFHQQLLQVLAYKGPGLLQDLQDRRFIVFIGIFEYGNKNTFFIYIKIGLVDMKKIKYQEFAILR